MISLVKEKIKPWSLWADDPKRPEVYNTYVDARDYPNQKPNFSAEYLMHSDELYDLLYVIDYNLDNPVPGLGSAIFLHIKTKPTAGCVGLKRKDLFELVPKIIANSEIIITNQCS